uniref:Transmembrane protein 39A n=1 Tax=Timema cristinae TaxID=61476 RepID=A0A7R9CAE7_TIMCR|nr:unnamed protein product [Timema cristinae]
MSSSRDHRLPVVISVIAAWNMRRWWNNSIPSHSHTVSRRRKFVRDSTIGRRPPPLPAIVQDRSSLKIYLQTERSGWSLKKRGSVSKSEEVSVMPGGRRSLARSSTSRQPPPPPNTLPLSEDVHKSSLSPSTLGSLQLVLSSPSSDTSESQCRRTQAGKRSVTKPPSQGQTTPDTPASRIISPKHIPIPSVPHDGSVMFEVVMFMFTATASFLQFLHLYRTVWWLPQSYTKYAMNFYLMDPYLVGFIATILSRRLVYCMLSHVVMSWSPINLWPLLQQLLSISVYFILFGLSVSPFFDANLSITAHFLLKQSERRYCDVLHRAALHLGRWASWADSTLWHQGALVKHCKEMYRAEGISIAAEPGNQTHSRFYAVFSNPSCLVFMLLFLQLAMVLMQLVILVGSSEWYQIISVSLLLFANYYTLFKLFRDYLICWKVYKAEQMIQEKIGG